MTQASEDYRALQMVAHTQRFTNHFDKPLQWRRNALCGRVARFLDTKGINTRKARLNVLKRLCGRQISSSLDLSAGEVEALLNEPNLEQIMEYIVDD